MTSNIIGSEWINGSKGWLWRGNSKSIFHGTGTEIAALDPVTPTSRYAFAGNGNDSVGSNNLTANGTPTYGSDGGVYGQYVILDGGSQYFTAANNTVFDVTTQDFSIWGYIYRTSDSGVEETIVGKRVVDVTSPGYRVFIGSDDLLYAELSATAFTRTTTTSTISTNTWYFFAVSFARSTNLTLYLYNMSSGAYKTATLDISTQSGSLTNTQTFTVGRDSASASSNYFPGHIDHLNVLIGTAITAQNVQDIISKLHGGQIAECHGTSGGFTTGLTYKRDMENTTWYQLVDTNNTQTLASKTLTSPTINGGALSGTFTGTPTFSGALTFSGNNTNSGTPKIDNAEDVKVISAPSDPSSGYNRIYGKAIDANNDGLFVKKKRSSAIIEVQLDRAPFYHQNPTEQSTTASVMTKIKESTLNITPKNGVLYISFQGKCGSSTSTFQIYRNGSAIGTSRATSSTTYTTWTEAISAAWAANDTVQIYASNTIGSTSSAQNLIIYEGTDGATANS